MARVIWQHDDEKTMRQQASMGGIAIKQYSPRYDAWVAVFNIQPNEEFGGIDGAIERAKTIVAAVNASLAA